MAAEEGEAEEGNRRIEKDAREREK